MNKTKNIFIVLDIILSIILIILIFIVLKNYLSKDLISPEKVGFTRYIKLKFNFII